MKEILIVSYSLSTSKGVGGRRWLKYIQELSKKYIVHVVTITGEYDLIEFNENVLIKDLKGNYPTILDQIPTKLTDKLKYRIALKKLSFLVKGTIYDKGSRLKNDLQGAISEVLKRNNIHNVIVTGAPFSFLYYTVKLKVNFPEVNFIADFRDPWTWGHGYGMQTLPKRRYLIEREREQYVIENADSIVSASQDINEVLNEKLNPFNKTSTLIMNGIEKEYSYDFTSSKSSNEIVITHIGSVNAGTEKHWKHFMNYLADSDANIVVKIVGNSNKEFELEANKILAESIVFIDRVPEKEIQKIIVDTDFLLMFKHDSFPNSFPSKFFDYIRSKKPIIAYTIHGEVSKEIVRNNIGVVITEKTEEVELNRIFNNDWNEVVNFNENYNWEKFSIESLAGNIEKLFIEV